MKAFKYNREDDYYFGDEKYKISSLKNKIDELINETGSDFRKELLAKEMSIYDMTRPSLKVNHLAVIKKIINQINTLFDKDKQLDINIYINRKETPEAKATVNDSLSGGKRDLIIILTQHFMNELNYNEKLAVIAHEVAHFNYKHTSVPYRKIINRFSYSQNVEEKIFVQNLKKWSICKEISADLLSLQITKSYESTAKALIKFTTGIMNDVDDVLRDLESHFSQLKHKNQCEVLKEHPLTLLRVLILKSVSEYFIENGWNADTSKVQEIINNEMSLIYPEIVYDRNMSNIQITFELGLLVGIADGNIDDNEIKYLKELIYNHQKEFNPVEQANMLTCKINNDPEMSAYEKAWVHIKDELPKINQSADNIDGLHISSIIRNLLTLASSDGEIDCNELRVIYLFAKEYGYSKGDIIQQMFNLK
jgi:hypothetical protein